MGILINTGFDVGSSNPIDSRTVKNTTDERDALISDGLVYENLKVYCKDTQTEYRWTGTDWEEVGTGETVDLSGYAKTYTSLTELGLTADATIDDVRDKLQVGESCCIRTDGFTNWSTLFNGIQWGYLRIAKTVNGLCEMWVNDITSDNRLYYGIQASGKFSKWQQVQTRLTYVSLTQMGLTADATIDDVISTLKDGETAMITTNEFTNYLTMFPNYCDKDQYAILKVERKNGNRCFIEWRQKDGNAYAIGGLKPSNEFSDWNNLVRFKKDGFADDSIICIGDTVSSDGVIQTLANLGFSNDILTWDTGVYRVSHVSGLINMPSDITSVAPSFRLEHHDIKKWGGNHNPTTQTWAQRHSVLYPEGGNVYHRFYESGATPGTYIKDTGWQQIITENSKTTDPYSCTGYTALTGTEDLFTLPCGHYASAKVDTSYNYPVTDSSNVTAHIYVLGCLNEPANNKGYRIILYFDNKGRMYSINEWWGSFSNGWQKIQTGNNKATLVTNTTTLKLDVTKKNSSYFGAIKLTYLYDTSPVEVEISFRSATEDLRWAVINGQKYIKKITFTQDSSNTAHYTIGIEFSGTTYGCYQAEVIGGFADINSLTSEAFTGAKTAVYYSPWGKNNGVTLVSSPEDIGLTYPCTSVQLAQAMRNKFNKTINAGAIGIFNCGGKATTITDAPADYGLLHIETFGHDRILIRFDGIGSSSYTGSWVGKIQSNNGAFNSITWSKLIYEENLSALNTGITTLNTKTTELNTKIATIENTKIPAINTKIAAIENTTNNSAIKNITDNTLTTTSNTFKVVINTPTSEGYWFIKFKYYIGGKEYEALIMSEVYDRYWSGNAPLVSSITSSANSQTNGTWNFSVGIKLSSSVTGVKIVECPSVANLVSFTTGNFTGANTHEKKS